jgi:urease accessory protein
MSWHAKLQLHYQHNDQSDGAGRTTAYHLHDGPLRILQSLYPEGGGICHNVLVHPPGGLVGGDTLSIDVQVASGAHGLVTTPGATRFYRSEGALALQTTTLKLAADARLEWLPLEALCYSGCKAENKLVMALEAGSELIGWDVTALGLPNANLPFARGEFLQHIELEHQWLERGRIAADDALLMNGPLGLTGHRCLASIFFVAGSPLTRSRKEKALEAARDAASSHTLAGTVGVTSPNPQVIVARVLSPVVEPAMALLRQIRDAWRRELWDLQSDHAPRIWNT